MKRFIAVAVLVVGLSAITSTSEAGDRLHGGHHAHHGDHAYGHGGYGYVPYSSYSYGGDYGGRSYGYGNGNGYQPRYREFYAPQPRYQSHGHHRHGGLHIDIGRLHLGYGAHH